MNDGTSSKTVGIIVSLAWDAAAMTNLESRQITEQALRGFLEDPSLDGTPRLHNRRLEQEAVAILDERAMTGVKLNAAIDSAHLHSPKRELKRTDMARRALAASHIVTRSFKDLRSVTPR